MAHKNYLVKTIIFFEHMKTIILCKLLQFRYDVNLGVN
jgi:hypothetical protein